MQKCIRGLLGSLVDDVFMKNRTIIFLTTSFQSDKIADYG
jgi:hypothetical protein